MSLINSGIKNEVFNIGANNHMTNLDVVADILKSFDCTVDGHVKFIDNRWGQDLRYSLNTEKLMKSGWVPEHSNGIFKWWEN